jgi:hypothetical protein
VTRVGHPDQRVAVARRGRRGRELLEPAAGVLEPGLGVGVVAVGAEREQVAGAFEVVDGEHAVGEEQGGVRGVGVVGGVAAGLGLELVAEAADVAEVEVERQPGRRGGGAPAQLLVEVVEERPAHALVPAGAVDVDDAVGDVEGDVFGERAGAVAHEREARQARDHRAAVQPEAGRLAAEQLAVGHLWVRPDRDAAHVHAVARLPAVGRRRGDAAARERKIAEVGEQLAAVLGDDRLGMKLDAPQRPLVVSDAHHHAVVGPGHDLELVGHLGGRQRVVADGQERRRQPGEHAGTGVVHGGDASVHRRRRVTDGPAEQMADALMTEADAQHRQPRLADRAGADPEIHRPLGPARPRRDDHAVEIVERDT